MDLTGAFFFFFFLDLLLLSWREAFGSSEVVPMELGKDICVISNKEGRDKCQEPFLPP